MIFYSANKGEEIVEDGVHWGNRGAMCSERQRRRSQPIRGVLV